MYAEDVHVVADDELTATLDLDLLPPLEHRLGLLLLVSGPAAEVVKPKRLARCGTELAQRLLEHHRPST
jgi:proteasome accessory factor C